MNEILSFLKFTLEIGDDFEDGKLPSLDTAIWVEWTTSQMEDHSNNEDGRQSSQQQEHHSQKRNSENATSSSQLEENCQAGRMTAWPVVMFEYFEKHMSSNLVVQARSALSEESKVSSLAEECVRRLRNTSRRCSSTRRVEIVEGLCTKMKTSGHTDKFMKKVILKGIRNYMTKLK